MENKILSKMQQDMNIRQYGGEKKASFIGRLVYSALCQWMRYIIMDETTQNYDRKSKAYILSRMKTLLINMVESFPESKYWFCTDEEINMDVDELIHQLRDKMLAAGELIEVDAERNIGLPKYGYTICVRGYQRLLGLDKQSHQAEFMGITRIVKSNTDDQHEKYNDIEIDSYLNWIFHRAIWNECNNLEMYEFFNPYSKKPPYQSWTNTMPRGGDSVLARATLYNGLHEYYLIKKECDKYYSSILLEILADWKEERRIILALRKKVGNPIWANYSEKNDVVILNLYCGIPIREQVIIDTYCWPFNSMGDKYNFVVPKTIWANIEDILTRGLGIEMRGRIL